MLEVFRKNLKHTKWILLLVAVTFVIFFGPGDCSDQSGPGPRGTAWVAVVDGEEIPAGVWQHQGRSLETYYRRLFGENYEQFSQGLDIPAAALSQLENGKLIARDAKRLGLRVSNAELSAMLLNDPGFQIDGKFVGKEQFKNLFARGGVQGYYSADAYLESFREQLLASKWQSLLAAGVVITDEELRETFRSRHETVDIEYIALPVSRYEEQINVDEPTLQAWYDTRRDEFNEGEARRATYVNFDDSLVSDKITLSDEQVTAYYEQNSDRFRRAEQRRASQVLIRVSEADPADKVENAKKLAEQVAQRARSGEPFATLASEYSAIEAAKGSGGDMGWLRRGQTDPNLSEAIFALQVNGVSDPVRTVQGFHVVKVMEIREAGVQPLEDVRPQIESLLKFEKLSSERDRLAQEFRDKVESAESFRAVATAAGYTISETGPTPRSGTIAGLGPVPAMIRELFSLEVGAVSAPVKLPRSTVVLVLDEVLPDYVPPLEDVRERVLAAYRREKAQEQAEAAVAAAKKHADGDISAIAERLALETQRSDPPLLRGQAIPQVGYAPEVETAAFAAEVGTVVGPIATGNTLVLFKVHAREEADFSTFATEAESIRQSLVAPRVQEIVENRLLKLRERAQITRNTALLNR